MSKERHPGAGTMRNLVLASSHTRSFPQVHLATLAVDVELEHIFVASESQNTDKDVCIEVHEVESTATDDVSACSLRILVLIGKVFLPDFSAVE